MNDEPDNNEPDDADDDADTEPAGELHDIEDILDSTGKVLNQQPMWDNLINADVILQQGGMIQLGKVKRRSIDDSGKLGHTVTIQSKIPSYMMLTSLMAS
jgi:hypothetical protein